jgi:hypothetical protein
METEKAHKLTTSNKILRRKKQKININKQEASIEKFLGQNE